MGVKKKKHKARVAKWKANQLQTYTSFLKKREAFISEINVEIAIKNKEIEDQNKPKEETPVLDIQLPKSDLFN